MKHLSAAWWAKAAAKAELVVESDLKELLRRRLAIVGCKEKLARDLGVTALKLTGILRGRNPVDTDVAEKLGYRRVIRFEPIE